MPLASGLIRPTRLITLARCGGGKDEDEIRRLDKVTLFLTKSEALELQQDLHRLLENQKEHHAHVSSDDYKKEITVCIY
jgi:hypothetical protein